MAVLKLGIDLFHENVGIISCLRFLFACGLLGLVGWAILSPLLDALARAKQMYKIPCTKCRFFTNDYRLKCTMNPYAANTEAAIDCSDYISD